MNEWLRHASARVVFIVAAANGGGDVEHGNLYENQDYNPDVIDIGDNDNTGTGIQANEGDLISSGYKLAEAGEKFQSGNIADIRDGVSDLLGATNIQSMNSSLDRWWDNSTSPLSIAAGRTQDLRDGMSHGLVSARNVTRYFSSGLSWARMGIGVIDTVCNVLHITNPVDEILRKPFGGDWDELSQSAQDWRGIATNLETMHTGLQQAQRQIRTSWKGEAFDRYSLCNDQIGQMFEGGPDICREIADGLDALVGVAKKCFDYALDVIEELIDLCMDIVEWAWTGVGLAVVAAKHAGSVISLIQNGYDIVQGLYDAAQSFKAVTAAASPLAQQAKSFATSLERT